jgi:hypothetical protein
VEQTLPERKIIGLIAVIAGIAVPQNPPNRMGAVVLDSDSFILCFGESTFFTGSFFEEGCAELQDVLVGVERSIADGDREV